MKLSHWAKEKGIQYNSAYKMFRKGQIPLAYKLQSGTIIVPTETNLNKQEYVVTYSRVSSSEDKTILDSQSKRLIDFCNAKGWTTNENIKEIGSGLNDKRPKLLKILKEGKATKIVVEHKDRLSRFGSNYIECAAKHFNCQVIYINNIQDEKEDLVQDFVNVITSFCARLYGQRRTKRQTEKLIKTLEIDSLH
jgi:putative resolvase